MNLFLRLLLVLIRARLAGKHLTLDDAATVRVKLSRRDLDRRGHVEKTRFASFADLGMVDFLERTGVMALARKNEWTPLLAARDMDLFAGHATGRHLTVETRLEGWDERYTFFLHNIAIDGTPVATLRSTGRVSSAKDKAPLVGKVLAGLGLDDRPAGVPEAYAGTLERMLAARANSKSVS